MKAELKPEELRVNSYYQYLSGDPFQLGMYDFGRLKDLPKHLWPQPIELSEEWLVKVGASKSFENWQYTIPVGAITLHFRCNTEWYSELGGIYLGSKIRYVHQLQNLYYALTGNELIFNHR